MITSLALPDCCCSQYLAILPLLRLFAGSFAGTHTQGLDGGLVAKGDYKIEHS